MKTWLKIVLIILGIIVFSIFLYVSAGLLFLHYFLTGVDVTKEEINVLQIKEVPIINENGFIEDIEFTVIIDPKTPIPDGKYKHNGCGFDSFTPNQANFLNPTNVGNCIHNDLIIKDNEFKLNIKSNLTSKPYNIMRNIVTYKINGPYILRIWNDLYQYKGSHTQQYTLKFEDDFNKEFCSSLIDEMRRDLCGYPKKIDLNLPGNRIYIIYKTNSYNYTQFVQTGGFFL